jgi:glycosyltransferase involved in cell wall biosynthesis
MTPLVSVVVPNYGWEAGGFLSESTYAQLRELGSAAELIVVDDGSSATDREEAAASLAACPDADFISLTTNEGPGRARQVGLERASGEWVLFVDADDQADVSHARNFLATAELARCDIVAFTAEIKAAAPVVDPPPSLRPKDLCDFLVRRPGLWRFAFRREFLHRNYITFSTLRYAEDLVFMVRCAAAQPRVVSAPACVYYQHNLRVHGREPSLEALDAASSALESITSRRPPPPRRVRTLAALWQWKFNLLARHEESSGDQRAGSNRRRRRSLIGGVSATAAIHYLSILLRSYAVERPVAISGRSWLSAVSGREE